MDDESGDDDRKMQSTSLRPWRSICFLDFILVYGE